MHIIRMLHNTLILLYFEIVLIRGVIINNNIFACQARHILKFESLFQMYTYDVRHACPMFLSSEIIHRYASR